MLHRLERGSIVGSLQWRHPRWLLVKVLPVPACIGTLLASGVIDIGASFRRLAAAGAFFLM